MDNGIKTLEELEQAVQPDSTRHWIYPGVVRAGAKILFSGSDLRIKSLLVAELAISATTYTKFLGAFDPWISARTVYLAGDAFTTLGFTRRLLQGRGMINAPEDLRFIPAPDEMSADFWGAVLPMTLEFKPRLVIVDQDSNFGGAPLLKNFLQQLYNTGATVVICSETPEEWRSWVGIEMFVKQDPIHHILYVSDSHDILFQAKVVASLRTIEFVEHP